LCLFAAVAFNSKARESNARDKIALPFDEGHYEESEVGGYGMKPLRTLESGTLVASVLATGCGGAGSSSIGPGTPPGPLAVSLSTSTVVAPQHQITWWGIYNEYNINGMTPSEYIQLYNTLVPAMLNVDSTIKISAMELSFSGATSITIDAKTNATSGPASLNITPAKKISVTLGRYGVTLLKLNP